jgi:hypothetical protein
LSEDSNAIPRSFFGMAFFRGTDYLNIYNEGQVTTHRVCFYSWITNTHHPPISINTFL